MNTEKAGQEIAAEQKTIAGMIRLYCHDNHHPAQELCPQCQELLLYAQSRIVKCPFQPDKPTCGQCPVHCYKTDMRVQIREVMRYSGPRLIFHDPISSFRHLARSLRRPSEKVRRARQLKQKLPDHSEPDN